MTPSNSPAHAPLPLTPAVPRRYAQPAQGPLRFGLIGAGGFGAFHLAALRALEQEGKLRLQAVADPNFANLKEVEAELKGRNIACHLDYREMLQQQGDLDVAVLITPIPYHLDMTLACLALGLHVYLEKPPVPVLQQLETLIQADVHGRVGVGFQMVGARWTRILKEAIVQGKIGKLREIRTAACWHRKDGYYHRARWAGRMSDQGLPVFDGPVTNALSHLIHNAMYLASDDPDGFACPVEVQGELYRSRPIESYDTASVRCRFASGATFTAAITHATEAYDAYQFEVRGSQGWARVSQDGARIESSFGSFDCLESTADTLQKAHLQFIDFFEGRAARPLTRLEDARGYLLATGGMLLSSGWIHDVPAQWVRPYGAPEDQGRDVAGLRQAVWASFETGRLFSELGVPWAVATSAVSVEGLKGVEFDVKKQTSWSFDRAQT